MPDPTRLSGNEYLILKLLTTHGGEMFGLEMVADSNKRLKKGSIYVTLGRMEDKGFVSSRKEDWVEGARGLPKRMYKITGEGQRVLQEWEFPRFGIIEV